MQVALLKEKKMMNGKGWRALGVGEIDAFVLESEGLGRERGTVKLITDKRDRNEIRSYQGAGNRIALILKRQTLPQTHFISWQAQQARTWVAGHSQMQG